jgi:hypothetical protein
MMLLVVLLGVCLAAPAQTTYSGMSVADAFLATGSPDNPEGTNLTGLNFGGAGILVIAPAGSVKGEFQSVVQFDLAGATSLFDTTYGTNNWTVSGISLQLTSNYGGAGDQPLNPIFPAANGGSFVIEWLSNNAWSEGTGTPSMPTTDGVTYDSLPVLLSGAHDILCTNTYSPPGDNVPVSYPLPLDTNLVAEVMQGGSVTLLFYAADNQISYLFNSYNYGRGNQPLIHATANGAQLELVTGVFTNGVFHLAGLGVANQQYQVQATTNPARTNWQVLGTVTSDGGGLIQFDDLTAANQAERFYRLSQ